MSKIEKDIIAILLRSPQTIGEITELLGYKKGSYANVVPYINALENKALVKLEKDRRIKRPGAKPSIVMLKKNYEAIQKICLEYPSLIFQLMEVPFTKKFLDDALLKVFDAASWDIVYGWKDNINHIEELRAIGAGGTYTDLIDMIRDAYGASPTLFRKVVGEDITEYRNIVVKTYQDTAMTLRFQLWGIGTLINPLELKPRGEPKPKWEPKPRYNFVHEFLIPVLGSTFLHVFFELSHDSGEYPQNKKIAEIHTKALSLYREVVSLPDRSDAQIYEGKVVRGTGEYMDLATAIDILWGAFYEVSGKEKCKEVEALLRDLLPEEESWAIASPESGKEWLEGFRKRKERQLKKG